MNTPARLLNSRRFNERAAISAKCANGVRPLRRGRRGLMGRGGGRVLDILQDNGAKVLDAYGRAKGASS